MEACRAEALVRGHSSIYNMTKCPTAVLILNLLKNKTVASWHRKVGVGVGVIKTSKFKVRSGVEGGEKNEGGFG